MTVAPDGVKILLQRPPKLPKAVLARGTERYQRHRATFIGTGSIHAVKVLVDICFHLRRPPARGPIRGSNPHFTSHNTWRSSNPMTGRRCFEGSDHMRFCHYTLVRVLGGQALAFAFHDVGGDICVPEISQG